MPKRDARILVVDDEEANVLLLERVLRMAGYEDVASTTDPRRVLEILSGFRPDLILLDLLMPHLDGFQVMNVLRSEAPIDQFPPVIVLTADATPETRRRALAAGATGFLTKPLDLDEVLLLIASMLEMRLPHLQQGKNEALEEASAGTNGGT